MSTENSINSIHAIFLVLISLKVLAHKLCIPINVQRPVRVSIVNSYVYFHIHLCVFRVRVRVRVRVTEHCKLMGQIALSLESSS